MQPFNVEAYCARIGWNGETRPTLATLNGLVRAHTASIPFENLDILLGRRIRLDAEGLQQKLVVAKRGGHCIEHVMLLGGILQTMGFKVGSQLARAVIFRARRRLHSFLTIDLDSGIFVVDAGFGVYSTLSPVPLRDEPVDPLNKACHRMSRDGKEWTLHVRHEGQLVPGWVARLEDNYPIDFSLVSYWIGTHPDSPFCRSITLTRAVPGGWLSVVNRDVRLILGDQVTTWQLEDRRALRSLVVEHFGFDVADIEWKRIPSIPGW